MRRINNNIAPPGSIMVQAIRSFFQSVADFSVWTGASKEDHTLGAYPVDYSEPAQGEIDAANAACADLFKSGNWISVNRKS